jgi:hypothetical protein
METQKLNTVAASPLQKLVSGVADALLTIAVCVVLMMSGILLEDHLWDTEINLWNFWAGMLYLKYLQWKASH